MDKPERAQPERAQPERAQPERAQPERAQPERAQPERAQPERIQPERAQPERAQPERAQPERAQPERIQKVLARAGVASRRAVEEMVAEGRITVNGHPARLGQRVDPEHDAVAVDGVSVGLRADLVYYLVNKPPGVVCTANDPQGRPTVVEMVPDEPRVFPVGRLDADSEGLLVLTNDGELAHRLTHPSFGVEKEYLALVEGRPGRGALRRLREGVELDDGPARATAVSLPEPSSVRIVVHEGRNRLVRRMCEAVGHPVLRLVRTRIGPLADRRLPPGQWRDLSQSEVRQLERSANPPGSE